MNTNNNTIPNLWASTRSDFVRRPAEKKKNERGVRHADDVKPPAPVQSAAFAPTLTWDYSVQHVVPRCGCCSVSEEDNATANLQKNAPQWFREEGKHLLNILSEQKIIHMLHPYSFISRLLHLKHLKESIGISWCFCDIRFVRSCSEEWKDTAGCTTRLRGHRHWYCHWQSVVW